MKEFDPVQNNKLLLAIRSFRDPADDDYSVARWSYFNGLEYPFFWHAQQCIEKYLKCGLILNGVSVKAVKPHKIEPLLDLAFDAFGDLIPESINPPPDFPQIDDPMLGFGETRRIVKKYESIGDPNNRYGLYSTDWNRVGIHSFDELCFALRRVCGILDARNSEGLSIRESLEKDRRYQLPMERKFKVPELEKMNFSFFPSAAMEIGKIIRQLLSGFTNSPLFLLVEDGSDEAKEAIQWFLDHAFMPISARRELENYLQT